MTLVSTVYRCSNHYNLVVCGATGFKDIVRNAPCEALDTASKGATRKSVRIVFVYNLRYIRSSLYDETSG